MVLRIDGNRIQVNGRWHEMQNDRIIEVIRELCRVNLSFNNFFTEEILPNLRIKKIHWIVNPSLNSLGEAIPDTENLPPSFYCVVLRRFPDIQDDAYLLVHEMEHCVLNELKYPIVEPDRDLLDCMRRYAKPIFNAFNSMIYDKLVNTKLKQFQFSLSECIETDLPPVQINNAYEFIYRTFRYVIKRRNARLLSDTYPQYEEELLRWYSENLPELRVKGDEIFTMLEEMPADSPEEVIEQIKKIASIYEWRAGPMTDSIIIWIRGNVH